MIDNECGAVGGMIIGRGNRSTQRKPAQVPLCPPQIPHHLTWARTRAAIVGSWWLTASAMAQPKSKVPVCNSIIVTLLPILTGDCINFVPQDMSDILWKQKGIYKYNTNIILWFCGFWIDLWHLLKLFSSPYKISSFQNHIQVMLMRVASRLWPILRLSNGLQMDLSL
jgi:hypothetical protein